MPQQVKLRKCGEHPDCQLQSVDGGDWEHTPNTIPIVERFTTLPPEQRVLLARLEEGVTKTGELQRLLTDQRQKAEDLLARIGNDTADLPKVQKLQRDAAKTGEALARAQLAVTAISSQLANQADHVDVSLEQATAVLSHLNESDQRITKSLHDAEELRGEVVNRVEKMDSLLSRFDTGLEKLGDLEAVHESVEVMVEDQRQEAITLHLRLDEMQRQVNHERDERLAATRKSVRTDGLLSQRIQELEDKA